MNYPNLSFTCAIWVGAGIITEKEADLLIAELSAEIIPSNWRKILARIEQILERKLTPH